MPPLVSRLSRSRAAGGAAPRERAAAVAPAADRHARRVAAAVAALGVALLGALLLFAFSGGEPGPATGAATVVPSDALLYLHLSTDPSRPAVKRASALLARLPDRGVALSALSQRLVAVVGGSSSTRFGRDIRPWLGKEAAFALLNTTGASAGSLIVLDVRRPQRAAAFLSAAGGQSAGRYRGTVLYRYPTGTEFAFVHGYLVFGLDAGVRAALDTAAGHRRSLAANPAYQQAAGDEPDDRVLDAYMSSAGVARVLDRQSGFLGGLGALLTQPALLGTAVSVSVTSPGLAVHLHSALSPRVAAADSSRLRSFSPTLASLLPTGSTLMLDAPNLSSVGPTVLTAMTRIGLLGGVPDLLHRLGYALIQEGTDPHSFLNLFNGETAVALARGSGAPALVIVTHTSDESNARVTLANFEAPMAQIFSSPSSGPGQEPIVSDVPIDGVTAHQMQLGPGLQVDYAVFRGLIVVATSLRGIGDVAARSRALSDDPSYQKVLGNQPDQVTSLGFADFSQLLSLVDQGSLARGATFAALQPDLQKIRAVGLQSTGGEADTTAELYLQIP